ncbi:MAG: FtsQ-type POTRA domain-containing protein [Candidatus Binatia bacterium]|nr:FtsQ-type POTRA domain-containing protein [Candidatus Binatia bacterium]
MKDALVLQWLVGIKRGGRENRRKPQRSWAALHRAWWYVGVVLVGGALLRDSGMMWSVVAQYAMRHPYFAVEEIEVRSDGRFTVEQIRAWSGVERGMSLWSIDPAQVEARLRAQPWVRSATVRREFPHRVLITVHTRRPLAIIVRQPFTYVDDTGSYFVPADALEEADLPYVSGLEQLPLDTPEAQRILATVVHLLSLARWWQEPLSEIRWDRHCGYTLFLAERQVAIRLGEQPTPEQFARVRTVLEMWPAPWSAALFDARFAHQVIVRPDIQSLGRAAAQYLTRRPL